MMVDIEHVQAGLTKYANTSVIPKLPAKYQFIAGMAVGLVASRAEQIIQELADHPAVSAMHIIDGRNIDLDALYNAAKEQIRRTPTLQVDVPLIGTMRFDEADLDALYQSIMKG